MTPVRVLVVDDEALIRHALRLFLGSSEHMNVVGEAIHGVDALVRCDELRPDVVLMDLQMPVMDGHRAIAQIATAYPGVRVLALTSFASRRDIVRALRAGASGYVVKDVSPDELIRAIRDVDQDQFVLSPKVARELAQSIRNATESDGLLSISPAGDLTPRELSMVELLAQGMSNAEIGRALTFRKRLSRRTSGT
jgi:DNA-binding NarL/FixJ family response regulator